MPRAKCFPLLYGMDEATMQQLGPIRGMRR